MHATRRHLSDQSTDTGRSADLLLEVIQATHAGFAFLLLPLGVGICKFQLLCNGLRERRLLPLLTLQHIKTGSHF